MFSGRVDERNDETRWGAMGPVRLAMSFLAEERDRWVLWIPVGIATGIAIYFSLRTEAALWVGPTLLILALVVLIASRHRSVATPIAMILIAPAAGFAAAQVATFLTDVETLDERIGPRQMIGQIRSVQDVTGGYRFVLTSATMDDLGQDDLPRRVRVRTPKGDWLPLPGDWAAGLVVLNPPPPSVAPHAFDFERYAFFKGIGAIGYSLGRMKPAADFESDHGGAMLLLSRIRRSVYQRIVAALPGREGAVAAALITGERGSIPAGTLQAMRDSGLAHLLAISGLHIGLVAGLIFFATRALLALWPTIALRHPIKKWSAVVALVGAFCYLLLSGMTVPTQRAFLMIALVLLAVMTDREGVSMRLVAFAAIVVLLLAPHTLMSASFQLSFAAVIALVAVYEALRARYAINLRTSSWWRQPLLYVGGVALTTFVASLATLPYALFHFGRITLYGLAANMIAVPVTAFWIMPWGLLALCLMPFGLEKVALVPMGWGIGVVLGAAESVASWPGAVLLMPMPPAWAIVLVTIGGLWLCLWRRRWRWLGLPVILIALIGFGAATPPSLLVSPDARLVAVRDRDEAWLFSSARRDAFVRDSWLRLVGAAEWRPWPEEGPSEGGALQCDTIGCLYSIAGRIVAIVKDPRAAAEDCAIADVVVALVPLDDRCRPRTGLAIDRFDLWRNGAYEIRFDGGEIRATSSRQVRGDRPWVGLP
ncbi:MAG: ComEC family competence protein [Alphaproteobacteria bacterium]|nr:ComEC family competence protein [Alphaproteobacteria bacterium]